MGHRSTAAAGISLHALPRRAALNSVRVSSEDNQKQQQRRASRKKRNRANDAKTYGAAGRAGGGAGRAAWYKQNGGSNEIREIAYRRFYHWRNLSGVGSSPGGSVAA